MRIKVGSTMAHRIVTISPLANAALGYCLWIVQQDVDTTGGKAQTVALIRSPSLLGSRFCSSRPSQGS